MLHYKKFVLSNKYDWVVFVHGMGGSSSIFYKQIKEYKKYFNVLFVDLRGHGKSKRSIKQANKYSFEDVSQDVLDVLDHLKIKSAHFVGVSLGAIIINSISQLSPSRIRSMVLAGAITRFDLRSKCLIYIGDIIKPVIPYMGLYRFFAWIIMPRSQHQHSRMMFVHDAKKLGQEEFIRWFKLSKKVEAVYHNVKDKVVQIPKLYVMGEGDHLFLKQVEKDIEHDPYASLSIIKDSGHVCNVDQSETFNQISINFIKQAQTFSALENIN